MTYTNLSNPLWKDVLDYLECPTKAPTLRYLNALIHAYIRKVPWESVSRIVKRRTTLATSECPRWPEEFWHDAMQYGFGGTCFESNLAFYSLLDSLGFTGYLIVNDMGTSRACHAATVLLLNGRKYLVDITIPVQCAAQINPHKAIRRQTPFQDYLIKPAGNNVYLVERSNHPQRYVFTLIDVPVSLSDYLLIVENDYQKTGHFLNSVVMTKVINGKTWRFFSDHRPFKMEIFSRGEKTEIMLQPKSIAHDLAETFHMPTSQIARALSWIENRETNLCAQPPMHSLFLERVTQ
jgi:arylamine N-acetyltransferase